MSTKDGNAETNISVAHARDGASNQSRSTSSLSSTAAMTAPAGNQVGPAARQKARRARIKADGLVSLRLNVTSAEAASLKALLHALREATPGPTTSEAITPPETVEEVAQGAQPAPVSMPLSDTYSAAENVTRPAGPSHAPDLAKLRQLARERRIERETRKSESARKLQARENIMTRLKAAAR